MSVSTTTSTAVSGGRKFDFVGFLEKYGVALVLVLLIVFFTSQNERFLSVRNITNILTEVSIYGIIAVGMTFVILTGGVDLAVGSLLAFAAMCAAAVIQAMGMSFALSWLVALVIAASCVWSAQSGRNDGAAGYDGDRKW